MHLMGVDVGGTFVDFVLFDAATGRSEVLKTSRGLDLATTMVEGILALTARMGCAPGDIDLIIHGTTVATNALLEHAGAPTGMLTTAGFRDIIHIGRHERPLNYSIQVDIPWQSRPLVRRRFRLPVPERLAPPDGSVLIPLDEEAVRAATLRLVDEGVTSVAICFLFSYLNDAHERRAAEIVREVAPQLYVCTSAEVIPQFREFERFTTTAINAFVGPAVRDYLQGLATALASHGIHAPLHVMQSNGGTATVAAAIRRPVTLLLSGPVGGVMGGIWTAPPGTPRLATLDVGGTSADIGIVTESGLTEARSRDTWIAGYPLAVPIIDIETIGAGGGSIAHVDSAGALHVGPRSAGAHPGPAAYGRGGHEPTVTDANVVLGRVPAALAGGLQLDRAAAEAAVAGVADRLGMEPLRVAAGIVRLVNEGMAAALRRKTIERGLDPRDFLLCCFGGGGPLHADALAAILGIPRVLIPPNPGVTSAAGLLTADLRYDLTVTFLNALDSLDAGALRERLHSADAQLRGQLHEDGCAAADITVQWAVDLRYRGQGYELKVPLEAAWLDADLQARLREGFHAAHEAEYGHAYADYPVDLVNLRLTATGALPHLQRRQAQGRSLAQARVAEVHTAFEHDGEVAWHATAVYERERLPLGQDIPGPAIVVQQDSTTLVGPGASFRRDGGDNLWINRP